MVNECMDFQTLIIHFVISLYSINMLCVTNNLADSDKHCIWFLYYCVIHASQNGRQHSNEFSHSHKRRINTKLLACQNVRIQQNLCCIFTYFFLQRPVCHMGNLLHFQPNKIKRKGKKWIHWVLGKQSKLK